MGVLISAREKPSDDRSLPHAAEYRAATRFHPIKASGRLQGRPVRALAPRPDPTCHIEEGIVRRSYLETYLERSMRSFVPAIRDLAEVRKGRPIALLDDFRTSRAGLNLIGIEGVSMIADRGLDVAAWGAGGIEDLGR
jgi:hypothetical protein